MAVSRVAIEVSRLMSSSAAGAAGGGAVTERPGFALRQGHHVSRPVGEPLEHYECRA
jgi:hypothetical protein